MYESQPDNAEAELVAPIIPFDTVTFDDASWGDDQLQDTATGSEANEISLDDAGVASASTHANDEATLELEPALGNEFTESENDGRYGLYVPQPSDELTELIENSGESTGTTGGVSGLLRPESELGRTWTSDGLGTFWVQQDVGDPSSRLVRRSQRFVGFPRPNYTE
jgi:hypothetical protein